MLICFDYFSPLINNSHEKIFFLHMHQLHIYPIYKLSPLVFSNAHFPRFQQRGPQNVPPCTIMNAGHSNTLTSQNLLHHERPSFDPIIYTLVRCIHSHPARIQGNIHTTAFIQTNGLPGNCSPLTVKLLAVFEYSCHLFLSAQTRATFSGILGFANSLSIPALLHAYLFSRPRVFLQLISPPSLCGLRD